MATSELAMTRPERVAEKSIVWRPLGVCRRSRLQILGEAQVEHLIGLVQDDGGHAVQSQRTAPQVIVGPARRGDNDVHPLLQLSELRRERLPSEDG